MDFGVHLPYKVQKPGIPYTTRGRIFQLVNLVHENDINSTYIIMYYQPLTLPETNISPLRIGRFSPTPTIDFQQNMLFLSGSSYTLED